MTASARAHGAARRRTWGAVEARWAELAALAAILVLAAVLRLPGLDQRGQWDSDQGRDMSVLQAMVTGGQIPLLGPHTLAGSFHHGALYYYLLAPAAALSGSDPVAVTDEMALFSILAVGAAWWLGREVGGRWAGLIAGALAALSPAGISEAIFIWNPNPVPLFAAVAFAAALRARRTRHARWWVLAGVGAMGAMQLHVEGGIVVLPLLAAFAADIRLRRRAGARVAPLGRAGVAAALIIAAGYLPLAVHELTTDFSELRALAAYVAGGGTSGAPIPERLLMVALRSLTWPFSGLVTDHVAASLATLVIVVGLSAVAWAWSGPGRRNARGAAEREEREREEPEAAGQPDEAGRWPVAWLLATLAFSVAALAVLAPTLAVVTPGLPNDHYHAFLDPLVIALVATGLARLATRSLRPSVAAGAAARAAGGPAARAVGIGLATLAVVALVIVEVAAWPPAVSPDGGWRLADQAAAHIVAEVDAGWPPDEPRLLASLPTFKPDDAMRFPLVRRGMDLQPAIVGDPAPGSLPTGVVVTVCDPLFDDVTGAPCGDIAETAWIATAYPPSTMQLVDRFRAGDRRVLSVFAPSRLADAARSAP